MTINMTNARISSSSDNLPFNFCSNHKFNYTRYESITIFTCVAVALSSPVAVAGNALVLAAIWRNPCLRTPSYIFLGGLAFTDFCTGLLGQPFYVLYRVAELVTDKTLYCIASAIAHSIVPYLIIITGLTITAMAVERWLLMSRRRLTVRRVYIIQGVFLFIPVPYMALRRLPGMKKYFDIPIVPIMEGFIGICCFAISTLAYFKVFRIIRRHKQQVHANTYAASINLEKYQKSVYTILWIMTLFLLSYSPYVFSTVFVELLNVSHETSTAVRHVSTTVMLLSSSLNPFLYIWRLREIRDEVKH
ncbi:hypothetical protein OS493_032360 [Desmophyllum pertusum]|uniref:G-protein coupled receptors family 1 profile domain-containing protein n=1 Tax=Desmophyllum pertusum TaxID=174260 RepID=A0A9W9YJC1_9CNID|nr:hypothetical protein OS493_032360 [Desmophyllum pertusum]